MNYDSVTTVGRKTERTDGRTHGGRKSAWGTIGHAASVAGRFVLYLVVALATAWVVVAGATAFGGLLAATVIGLGVVAVLPWVVITGVVRVLDAVE